MPRKPKQTADDGLTLHTTFRLPHELHDRLTKAAAEHGYGIGEEIRQRLEASFADGPASDDETRRLLNAVARIASDVADAYGGSWCADGFASHVFRDAVRELLDWAVISGEAAPREPKPGSAIARILEKHPSADIGVMIGVTAAGNGGFL